MQKILQPAPIGLLRLLSSLWFQIILLVVLCLTIFPRNSAALFYGFDGAYMRQLTKFNFEWCAFQTDLSLNPLQGLGGVNFPVNYWFSIPSVLSYLISGPTPNSVLVYTFTTLELFLAIWFLARSMGESLNVTMVSSWGGAIFCMPFILPLNTVIAGFYPISSIVPCTIEHIAITTVTFALISKMEANHSWQNILRGGLALCLVHLSIIEFGAAFVLTVPFLGIFGIYKCLHLLRTVRRVRSVALVVLVGLLSLIFPTLHSASLLMDSVPAFFSSELGATYGDPSWVFISILAHGFLDLGGGSTYVYFFALAGSLIAIVSKRKSVSNVGFFYVAYSITLVALGFLTTFVFRSYRGPAMLYFEWHLWPLMFVFTAHFFESICKAGERSFSSLHSFISRFSFRSYGRVTTAMLIPAASFGWIFILNQPKLFTDLPKPPKRTAVIDFLHKQLAISPGSRWKGSVANFSGLKEGNVGTGWAEQATHDLTQWQSTGADRRSIGLWWNNVPTLFAYNQCMPPDYYYVVTRLFATPEDTQQRSLPILTKPDTNLLRLFGVKYFITSTKIKTPQNETIVNDFPWEDGSTNSNHKEFLYEVNDPNVDGFSPTHQLIETTGKSAVAAMKSAKFDPQLHFVSGEKLNFKLTKASSSAIWWHKHGLHVTGVAPGWCLLVLPLQFSHNLGIPPTVVSEVPPPVLIRVNIAMVGVLFKDRLDSIIQLHLGPFESPLAKYGDFSDHKYLFRAAQTLDKIDSTLLFNPK
jgi:hypothetical protein